MVSPVTAILACTLGFMVYVAIPVGAMTAPVAIREKIGTFYLKLGAKSLKQFTFVRRVLSGYDILPITVDDEQKLLEVKLSGSRLGEDSKHRFGDPGNRISRLFSKPVAVAFELVPAAVDAELAEWGHWIREKGEDKGLVVETDDGVRVDPFVEAESSLRLVDPIDIYATVTNDVDAENIKTAEKLTKKRYELYDQGVDIGQTLRVLVSAAVGAGIIIGMRYIDRELIGSSGGGGPSIIGEEMLMVMPDPGVVSVAGDLAVVML